MNATEHGIATHIGTEALAFLQTRTLGIAGLGGLGSNCAMHLVRSGFKRLVLVDFDRVEASNLNRQHFFTSQVGMAKTDALTENLLAVNPDLELHLYQCKVTTNNTLEIFSSCHAVVEAFDDPRAKKILAEGVLPTDRLLVSASGLGGWGRAETITTCRLRENFILIGDQHTACESNTPPLSPMVGVAAAKQADAVLSYFLKSFKETNHAQQT